jgi:hypothetical protein
MSTPPFSNSPDRLFNSTLFLRHLCFLSFSLLCVPNHPRPCPPPHLAPCPVARYHAETLAATLGSLADADTEDRREAARMATGHLVARHAALISGTAALQDQVAALKEERDREVDSVLNNMAMERARQAAALEHAVRRRADQKKAALARAQAVQSAQQQAVHAEQLVSLGGQRGQGGGLRVCFKVPEWRPRAVVVALGTTRPYTPLCQGRLICVSACSWWGLGVGSYHPASCSNPAPPPLHAFPPCQSLPVVLCGLPQVRVDIGEADVGNVQTHSEWERQVLDAVRTQGILEGGSPARPGTSHSHSSPSNRPGTAGAGRPGTSGAGSKVSPLHRRTIVGASALATAKRLADDVKRTNASEAAALQARQAAELAALAQAAEAEAVAAAARGGCLISEQGRGQGDALLLLLLVCVALASLETLLDCRCCWGALVACSSRNPYSRVYACVRLCCVAPSPPAAAEDEERKRAIIATRRAEFNATLASRGAASPDELATLKAEFEREAEAVANAVADERRRQQDQLQTRLAAKRDRQRRAVERRQEVERLELAAQQVRGVLRCVVQHSGCLGVCCRSWGSKH